VKALFTASVVCVGLMAGIFFAFTTSVMPGLRATDDSTFVTAMRHLNAAIENGLFLLVLFGALLFPAVLAVLLARAGRPFAWVAAAAGLYLLVLIVTMAVEVPLNERLAHAAVSRADFERVWVPVNNLRTVLSTLALACLSRVMVAGWIR
jgi:uncharacterized membrane protein